MGGGGLNIPYRIDFLFVTNVRCVVRCMTVITFVLTFSLGVLILRTVTDVLCSPLFFSFSFWPEEMGLLVLG